MGSFAGNFSDHHLSRSLVAQFNTKESILIPRPEEARLKLAHMISDKQVSLLTDFDFTLSRQYMDGGQQCDGSFTIFRNVRVCYIQPKYLSKHFMTITDELLHKYHPIQTDKTIPLDIKQEKMEEWWKLQFTQFTNEKVRVADCDEMILSSLFYYRHGIQALIRDAIHKHKIPLYIVSAGFGILIEESLKNILPSELVKEMISSEQIRIYANTLGTDKDGFLTQLVPGIVHSCNKHRILQNEADSSQLSGNVIIMGDRLHDLDIVKNLKPKNTLKIGFYNQTDEEEKNERLKKYQDEFDILIMNDGNLDHIAFLLEVIHSGGSVDSHHEKIPSAILSLVS